MWVMSKPLLYQFLLNFLQIYLENYDLKLKFEDFLVNSKMIFLWIEGRFNLVFKWDSDLDSSRYEEHICKIKF